jgi:hypothetical protein
MSKRERDLDAELDQLRLQTRVCQFCREYGRTWYENREVFKYGVRHYAHAWCLAREKVAENAAQLLAEHERADFWAKREARKKKVAEFVRERFEEWTEANGGEPAQLMEEELLDQLEDRLPGLDGQEIYAALRELGAVATETSGPAYDNETVTVYRLPVESSQVKFTQTAVDGNGVVTITFERRGNELVAKSVEVQEPKKAPLRIFPRGRRRHDLANAIVAAVSKGRPVVVVGTAEQERALRRRMKKVLDAHPEYAAVTYERGTR